MVLGMSAAFIFAYDVVTQSDYFRVNQIEIIGARRLSAEEICRRARIKKGTNIFSTNLAQAKKRLLAHPWIAEAGIHLRPPNHIQMVITEHVPLAFIVLDRIYIMNRRGELFKEKSKLDLFRLPVVYGLEFRDLNLPDKPHRPSFQAVMEVLTLGGNPDCVLSNRAIKEIHVDREIGLTVYAFKSKVAIRLGYSDYAGKYVRLKRTLSYLRESKAYEGARYIDMNNAKRVVVKPVAPDENGTEYQEV
jgi:cell division septal protein FtsQ